MARSGAVLAEPTSPAARIAPNQIGGGRVMRGFRAGGKFIKAGTALSPEQILSINPSNRVALMGRFISVWPKAADAGFASSSAAGAERAGRHLVSAGFGRFHVVEGILLTDEPVSRAEAYALAGKTAPIKKRGKESQHGDRVRRQV